MNFISTTSGIHLAKMEFLENKHHMQAFLTLAETKLKSWIIKYGQQDSVELMLHNYVVSSGFDLLFVLSTEIFISFSELLCRLEKLRKVWKEIHFKVLSDNSHKIVKSIPST